MRRIAFSALVVSSFALLGWFAPMASAQSNISGQVRDTSGAVMAGVRVEASSPALIEGMRAATTDGEGRYAIVNVRPGTYTITFTMEGFAVVKQEVEIPANVSVPVDGEMKVGSEVRVVSGRIFLATCILLHS